ncbi:MAG TPA: hypothetical protein VFO05_02065 [Candidatus Limnocylindrales bacterium]|nr:hypothetical protein [Candidatus Limnocylindrales bacterium]
MGRYGETAVWIVIALIQGPRTVVGLLDEVHGLDRRVGPGRLLGAVARLERRGLIETARQAGGPGYRLSFRSLPGASPSPTMPSSTEVPSA